VQSGAIAGIFIGCVPSSRLFVIFLYGPDHHDLHPVVSGPAGWA